MGSGARESSERVRDCVGQYPGSVEEGGRSISSCPGQLSCQLHMEQGALESEPKSSL